MSTGVQRQKFIEYSNMSSHPSNLNSIIKQNYSINRRLSVHLTAPIENIPQIKLTIATPTLSTTHTSYARRRFPIKDWNKLHPTWVGKRRGQIAGSPLRGVKKVVKRKLKQKLAKDWQSSSGRNSCHSGYRGKVAKDRLRYSSETSTKGRPKK